MLQLKLADGFRLVFFCQGGEMMGCAVSGALIFLKFTKYLKLLNGKNQEGGITQGRGVSRGPRKPVNFALILEKTELHVLPDA